MSQNDTTGHSPRQFFLSPLKIPHTDNRTQSSLLLSLRAGFNLVLLLAGLPVLTSLIMTKWEMSTAEKDLYLSRTSACLVTLGFLGIATAPNPPLVIIGTYPSIHSSPSSSL